MSSYPLFSGFFTPIPHGVRSLLHRRQGPDTGWRTRRVSPQPYNPVLDSSSPMTPNRLSRSGEGVGV